MRTNLIAALIFSLLFAASCSNDFKDLSTENGRKAIIDEANNYLTVGACDSALEILQPLYFSRYVDNDIRLLYASAYACKGGMNFVSLLAELQSSGSDIWSALVKSNYSASSADGKTDNLITAASIVRLTASIPGSFEAQYRTQDANIFMIFIQASIVATVISPLGVANPANGHETVSTWPAGSSNAQRCLVTVAIATIRDSLNYVDTGTAIDTVSQSINTTCGGACPSTRDSAACVAADFVSGLALMTSISTQWTGP